MRSDRGAQRRIGKEPPVHGLSGYNNYNCRCAICRAAKKRHNREYADARLAYDGRTPAEREIERMWRAS